MFRVSLAAILLTTVAASAAQPGDDQRNNGRRSQSSGNRFQPTDPPYASSYTSTIEDGFRIIRANGIPDHQTGQFPNRGNPNSIRQQEYFFRVAASPKAAKKATPLGMQPFGVAVNGVVFDPRAAEWWNGARNSIWQYEPLTSHVTLGADMNDAHVQPSGAYHYHGVPHALLKKRMGESTKLTLLGWAADGFPIYGPYGLSNPQDLNSKVKRMKPSFRLRTGQRPGGSKGPGGEYDGSFTADWVYVNGAGDLDECNGRFGVTPEFPKGIYHYYLTEEFPFVPRAFRGAPSESFNRRGGPGGRPPRGGAPRPERR